MLPHQSRPCSAGFLRSQSVGIDTDNGSLRRLQKILPFCFPELFYLSILIQWDRVAILKLRSFFLKEEESEG
jgi:hypothetical protein